MVLKLIETLDYSLIYEVLIYVIYIYGFRQKRTTVGQILAIRRILEGIKDKNVLAIFTFIDINAFEEVDIVAGVLQGDTLSPYLFIIVLDYALRKAINGQCPSDMERN